MPAPDRTVSTRPGCGERPRLLFLSCHLPWPAISGGRRRELELIKRLSRRFDVHLLVVSKTFEQDMHNAAALRRHCREVEIFPASAAPVREASARDEPFQVARHRSGRAGARVGEILVRDGADLVHVEGFYLMQHVPGWVQVPVLLVEQNIEYDLERQRIAAAARDHPRTREYEACVRAEVDCWSRASSLAAVTGEDAAMIRAARPAADIRLVPDGSDHVPHLRALSSSRAIERPSEPLVALVANFGYAPNVDAALHLCREIMPRVRAKISDVHLWLVGNAPPPEVKALANDHVRITGRVPDVIPYVDAADVIACPLRIGGGIKVKAIEALRRGKAIVSTAVGAQGLPPAARDALVIAEDAVSFADGILTLLTDRSRRGELERRAARATAILPTWDDAALALMAAYDDLLAQAPARNHAFLSAATAKVSA